MEQSAGVNGGGTCVQLTPPLNVCQTSPLLATAYPYSPEVPGPPGTLVGWKARSVKFSPAGIPAPGTNELPLKYSIFPFVVAYQKRVGDW